LQYHTQVLCCTWCLTWTHNHSCCTTATAYDSFSLLRLPYFCSVWFLLPPKIALVLPLFVECCAVFSNWSRDSGIGIPSTIINRVCTQTCKGCRMCFWGQTLKKAECDWRWEFWVKEKALPSHRAAHHNDTMKDVESSMPISNRWETDSCSFDHKLCSHPNTHIHTHTFIRLLEKQGANKQPCIELHWAFSFGNTSGKINFKYMIWSAPGLIPLSFSWKRDYIEVEAHLQIHLS
jgi:hypothetical protein